MTRLVPTAGQTIGPFFGLGLPYAGDAELVPPERPDAVQLTGRVLDGAGAPVPDALVELWQRAPDGAIVAQPGSLRRDGRTFTGWGRAGTDGDGWYAFATLRPGGAVPFFALTVFARGLTNRLFTRAYLPVDPDAVQRDPLLVALMPEERRTLIAAETERGLRFDIRLQGADETVFLRYPAQPER